MGNAKSICNGQIIFFETEKGFEFATQPENRRESSSGGDDLNVVVVTRANLSEFINTFVDYEADTLKEASIRANRGIA